MLLFYAKYAFLFWLFIDENQGNLILMRELSKEEVLLNLTACTKRCLLTIPNKVTPIARKDLHVLYLSFSLSLSRLEFFDLLRLLW